MSKTIRIRKGLSINLQGKAEQIIGTTPASALYAIKPTDFHNLTPKLKVEVDEEVKAGTPLFFDKYRPDIVFTSPVSGKVKAINRGERRRLLEIVVAAGDGEMLYENFVKADPLTLTPQVIKENLLKSGIWPFIRQRPYAVIANPEHEPKAIFISAFDSAPLAPDYDYILKNEKEAFQTGLNALSKLTKKVNLNINETANFADVFTKAKHVEINNFRGPHPSGSIGVQIHHISPISKGEIVWYVSPAEVATIGRLFLTGKYDASRIVALTGSEVKEPRYFKTFVGANITGFISNKLKESKESPRIISGNVLTGNKIDSNGFLGFYDSQITAIPEGKHFEFMGWLTPGFKKFSASRSFFSWLRPSKEYRIDTNLNGGERAFVVNGQYEQVVPMDIYPVHLIKAILAEDVEKMEQLGIYEVAEEDLALCEFVCTSKIEVQEIVRKGINIMMKEMG